jgi:hypothetical protein
MNWKLKATHVAHSLGANRFTLAVIEASMRFFCDTLPGSDWVTTKDKTV